MRFQVFLKLAVDVWTILRNDPEIRLRGLRRLVRCAAAQNAVTRFTDVSSKGQPYGPLSAAAKGAKTGGKYKMKSILAMALLASVAWPCYAAQIDVNQSTITI